MILDHFDIPNSPFAVVPKFGQTVDYSILAQKLSYPLFAKPVAASTSNGITPSSKILRREDLKPNIEEISDRIQRPGDSTRRIPSRARVYGRHSRDRR